MVPHLCGHCVQNLPVLEDDEPGHVRHDLPLAELLAHVDLQQRSQSQLSTDRSSQPIRAHLDVGQPHLRHEVGRAHEAAVRAPVRRGLVDHNPDQSGTRIRVT